MRTKRGIIVGLNLIKGAERFKRFLSVPVFADEEGGEGTGESPNTNEEDKGERPTINYEDLISKARAEEKQKQYNKIKKLEEQNKALTEKQNELLLRVGQLETDLTTAENKLTAADKSDTEEVKTLKSELETVKKDLENAKAELKKYEDNPPVDEEAVEKRVREEVQKEYEVKLYRTEKIAQYKDDPTFISDLVVGDTKEAIDTSFKATLDRSNEIKKSLGLTQSGSPDGRKGNGRTPHTPNNPASQFGGGNSIEQLATIDPRKNPKEYKELRQQLGLE